MKSYSKLISTAVFATVVLAALCVGTPAKAEDVYRNTNNYTFNDFQTGVLEVGDEITLGGTLRSLSYFQFDYYALNVPNDVVNIQLRFYINDDVNSQFFNSPGTLLFDSGIFQVPESAANGVAFNDFVTGVATPLLVDVPNSFTWSVQFSDIGSGDVGLRIYGADGNNLGSSQNDYWINDGGWLAETNINGSAINFGAYAQAVPEPTAVVLTMLGGLSLLALKLRSNKRKI